MLKIFEECLSLSEDASILWGRLKFIDNGLKFFLRNVKFDLEILSILKKCLCLLVNARDSQGTFKLIANA